jgi:hypothetical protein
MESLTLFLLLMQVPLGSTYVPSPGPAPSSSRPVILLVPGQPILLIPGHPVVLE